MKDERKAKARAAKPELKGGAARAGAGETPTKEEGAITGGEKATPQRTKEQEEMAALLKEMEKAMFAVRFYPVAVNEQSRDEALAKLAGTYRDGNDTVRQMLLYMVHDVLATSTELKTMHTSEYFRLKTPGADASQQRVSVYRAMFNYNTSLEGHITLMRFLGGLTPGDDAAKLLTYHFSRLCTAEYEASRMLRAAAIEALGRSDSKYALLALIDYAHYTDSEKTFDRIVSALMEWEKKVDGLKIADREKDVIRAKLREIITSEFGGSHYG